MKYQSKFELCQVNEFLVFPENQIRYYFDIITLIQKKVFHWTEAI